MHAELLDERMFRAIPTTRQQSLIAEHCQGVVEKIRTAENPENARRAVHEACEAFERDCSSALVRRALEGFLDRIYSERWQAHES